MHTIYLIILSLYLATLYKFGWRVMKIWLSGFPTLFQIVGAFLTGTGIGVPVTYLFSVVFARTTDPILWGTISCIVLVALFLFFWKKETPNIKRERLSLGDGAFVVLSLVFSSWLMIKTLHGDASGQLFVGSNTIFDSAYLVGLVRSMSWGANIPFGSPYFAGAPLFYHFFFIFWVALFEHFGIPIVWAVNIPGILSFTALLIVVYYLPQLLAKQKPVVGWLAVLFTITNSSLTFWYMRNINDVWRLPAYPFAGPFDSSVISIFITLNNYVNQRHLAFAVAGGLFLYIIAARFISQKGMTTGKSAILGIAVGLLFLWNMAIFALTTGLICLLLTLRRQWKPLVQFVAAVAILIFISVVPQAEYLYQAAKFINTLFISSSYGSYRDLPAWNIGNYLWQNLGILPMAAGLGYMVIAKKVRTPFIPLVISFIGLCLLAGIGKRGFDQKFLSFLIIGVNVLAASAVWWLWIRWKIIAVLVIIVMTVSGFIDLMPIKNEFAYPLIDKQTVPVISWIKKATPNKTIFVSYSDMIDPVVMAGRMNYFGFYGNVGWFDRSESISRIYAGDIAEAKTHNISYVLVPKWKKDDFPYVIDMKLLRTTYTVAYEDDRVVIFGI